MKKIFVVILMFALSVFAINADARSIGRSSSFSRPSSYGTVKNSYTPSRSYTPSPSYSPRPTYTYNPPPRPVVNNYNTTTTNNSSGSGSFWSHAGAFGAGALVGHVLTPTQQVVQQPVQPVYQQPVQPVYQQQPVVVQPSVQPVVVSNQSSSNGFLWFFLIVALGAIGYFMYRAATQRSNDEVGLELPFAPIQKFNQIQTAFAMGNVSVLNETLGPNVYDQMIHDLPAAEDRKNPNLTQISYNVEEHTKNFLAIRYHYTDADENNRYAEDVWNFVLINGAWKLDGIQQIV